MNVFVNDDGTLEDIKTVKETEPDHDQLEQRFSDEEDSAGKKKPTYSLSKYRYNMPRLSLWY